MRVLIDTNVVLDFLQEREPFGKDATKLFERFDADIARRTCSECGCVHEKRLPSVASF